MDENKLNGFDENADESMENSQSNDNIVDEIVSDDTVTDKCSCEDSCEINIPTDEENITKTTETAENVETVETAETAGKSETAEPSATEKNTQKTESETPPAILYKWDYSQQYASDNIDNKKPEKKKSKKGVLVYSIIMTLAFLLAFSILIVSISLDDLKGFKEEISLADVAEIGMPSTVYIMGYKSDVSGSSGSGFAITDNGYIVTNYHVVENCKSVVVVDYLNNSYPASVVGYNKSIDIAVLYAENAKIIPVSIGDSDALRLGDKLLAIGNPENNSLNFSVTDGIVSGLNRKMSDGKTMIQTNLPVNPGNSGGPMFDSKGNLVGIITSKMMYGSEDDNGEKLPVEGISFAIPINEVVDLIFGYIEKDLDKPVLGVTAVSVEKGNDYFLDMDLGGIQRVTKKGSLYFVVLPNGQTEPLTDERLNKKGNKLFHAGESGIYITNVVKGLGAYGKLQEGDIVIKMGDIRIASVANVKDIFKEYSVGDKIKVEFYRDGKLSSLEMTLKSKGDMLEANRK